MRDPHVEAVYYEIGTGEGVSFGNPPTLNLTNHLGSFELANGKLTVRPATHYASGDEARAVLDPFLRAWELDSDLSRNIGSIRFKYSGVHKIDRNPPAPSSGAVSLSVAAADLILAGAAASVHITQHTYPPPPEDFRTTPEVEVAYGRWLAFREGHEPLPSMAYAVLTLVEAMAGGRRQAGTTLQIHARVLDTIGRLSSTKGGATARKFEGGAPPKPLSGPESTWLEAAVRRVVRRIGEHAAGAPLAPIAMKDLPTI